MKQIDELLNKYIDNELSVSELKELKEYLSANQSESENLKALKLIDDILRELEYESAPKNFTEKLMNRLNVKYSVKHQKNYFVRVIFSLFGLAFISIFLFGISQTSFQFDETKNESFENFFDKLGEMIPSFNFAISSDLLMLIVSTLVLITLVATYLIVNSHKAFKNSLQNLTH